MRSDSRPWANFFYSSDYNKFHKNILKSLKNKSLKFKNFENSRSPHFFTKFELRSLSKKISKIFQSLPAKFNLKCIKDSEFQHFIILVLWFSFIIEYDKG